MELKVKKVNPEAILPSYAHSGDAGMDLYALEKTVVNARSRAVLRTGVAMAIPVGYVGIIFGKSGLAVNHGIQKAAGVIDSGYRGEVQVVIHNTTDTPYTFAAGDKVAQMLIQPVECPALIETNELDDTTRGISGFGSTGK